MADIQKLTYPYFTDGETRLEAQTLNPIIAKMNEMIEAINSGVTPTPTQTVATPTISISGTTATISCSTSGATIYYTTNGNTPTTSSTQYSSPITLSGACTTKAIAVKSGMNNSSVASQPYTPSVQPDADATAIMARYSKSLTSAQQSAFNTFIVGLKNAGIYNKIVYMVLPVLANNLTEATQNALTGSSAFYNTIDATNINFVDGGITPVIGGAKAQLIATDASNAYLMSRNFHVSGYNVNELTDAEYALAQQLLISSATIQSVGKKYFKNKNAGVRYVDNDGSQIDIETTHPSAELASKSPTHIVCSFTSDKVIFSINGHSDVNNTPIKDIEVYNTKRPRLGEYAPTSGDNYTDPTGKDIAGATKCKYGFISWGYALTEQQCVAFNGYVETMMQAFV